MTNSEPISANYKTIRLPGTVWSDCLDPKCSDMQAELGLPEPRIMKMGQGLQVIYDDVPEDVAERTRLYLLDMMECRAGCDDEHDRRMAYFIKDAVARMFRKAKR